MGWGFSKRFSKQQPLKGGQAMSAVKRWVSEDFIFKNRKKGKRVMEN